ncbi:MAG: rubrerythrin family protein [Patescibacteria group bacterium]|jgi:rubrerythrin
MLNNMKSTLGGKKSQENLLKAFAGESMARNKYMFFAKQARKEGFEWIARIFEETSDNERAHAEEEYEHMSGKVEMTNTYDIHSIGTTVENLKAAAGGEKFETESMYPDFEKVARAENETAIATLFKEIGEVEKKHEERYLLLAQKLEDGSLYKSNTEKEWKCENCGYIHKGTEAPKNCPLCKKPQGWYRPLGLVR